MRNLIGKKGEELKERLKSSVFAYFWIQWLLWDSFRYTWVYFLHMHVALAAVA